MSRSRAAAVADAVLYEGYMLYPYRRSALKDRGATLFGVMRPRDDAASSEPWRLGCECLITAPADATLAAAVRFLVPLDPAHGGPSADPCEVPVAPTPLAALAERALEVPFGVGADARRIDGRVRLEAHEVGEGVYRVAVALMNLSRAGADAAARRIVSAQAVLTTEGGAFVPPRDPPAALAAAAAACRSEGLWPILLGAPGDRHLLLCSPIILDDHPEVAPESAADLFDATEIDELLTLRVLTLSDTERREIEQGDERMRALLARADATTPDDLHRLHGALRRSSVADASAAPAPFAPGDRVRLRPRGRADIFDIALAGRAATVISLEHDLDDRRYVVVTVDDDPGSDLGALGKAGHRFFFGVDEIEPLAGT